MQSTYNTNSAAQEILTAAVTYGDDVIGIDFVFYGANFDVATLDNTTLIKVSVATKDCLEGHCIRGLPMIMDEDLEAFLRVFVAMHHPVRLWTGTYCTAWGQPLDHAKAFQGDPKSRRGRLLDALLHDVITQSNHMLERLASGPTLQAV